MTREWTLTRLPSGYLHFRLDREVWAQWPEWQTTGPTRQDCFHDESSWPLVAAEWAERLKRLAGLIEETRSHELWRVGPDGARSIT